MCTIDWFLKKTSPKSLVLGNGFSLCFSELFGWKNLIDNEDLENIAKIFGTHNIENMLERLNYGKAVLSFLNINNDQYQKKIEDEIYRIREIFLTSLRDKHPSTKSQVNFSNLRCLINTLKSFDYIFTTNYDLILYWIIMDSKQDFCDGFSNNIGKYKNLFAPIKNYAKDNGMKQVYYLHGALHLFQTDMGTNKLTYKDNQNLITQIQGNKELPLIILEADSQTKIQQIESNFYLKHTYDLLNEITGNIYTFGISFEKDTHIIERLNKNPNIDNIFLGVHNDNQIIPNHLSSYEKINPYNTKKFNFNNHF